MLDISLIQVNENTGRVTFKLAPKGVKGLTKLTQIVVLSLLNNPGKDILDPESGGGIPEMIGMNFDPQDLSEVLTEVSRKVKKTESEIITDQISVELPQDERLRELRILGVGPGKSTDTIDIKLRIINELGKHSDVVL